MKKLILATIMVAGASMAGYSQGVVLFNDETTPGYVVVDNNGPASSSTASYTAANNFTAALYALPGNVSSTAGLGVDAYGYLTTSQFNSDGFVLIGTTLGGTANGVSAGDGYFDGGKATLAATPGGYDLGSSTYTSSDVLAIVAWTGTWADLTTAMANNAAIGIFAFVNPIGPGGTDPHIPNLTGWPTQLSPANSANDGFPELVLTPVPEPTTLALGGLGAAALLALRRRKA